MGLKACANDHGDAKATEGMGSKYPPYYRIRQYAKWAMKRFRRNKEKQDLQKIKVRGEDHDGAMD